MAIQNRRTIVAAIGTAISGLLSGCISFNFTPGPNHVDLVLMNTTEQTRTLHVLVKNPQGRKVYENTFDISPDEEIRKQNLLTGDQFEVTASVDARPSSTETYHETDCENQEIILHVHHDGDLRITYPTC
jgi:hypothetical protein